MNRRKVGQCAVTAAMAALAVALPLQATAQSDSGQQVWLGLDLGSGLVDSQAPAPSADRSGVAASMELGYRFTPNWGLGLEWGVIAPTSGCAEWQCGNSTADFAPTFSHTFLFGEYRPRDAGWQFRAGAGLSRFCYQRHWNEGAWSVWDTVLAIIDDDYLLYVDGGGGAYRCDASRNALGGSASVGYDWRVSENGPVLLGARLTAEAANFSGGSSAGPPLFRHRAITLTLHIAFN